MHSERQIETVLRELVERLDPAPPDSAPEQLRQLAEMVEDWGERMNLSGHRSALALSRSLIGDAVDLVVEIERVMEQPIRGSVVDLGSGAGFPGLPLAILRPETDVHLIEIREKRHLFQRAACRQLPIANAHPVRARIEDEAVGPAGLVLAQAVGPAADVIRWMRPYLAPGSWAVVPGGPELESPPDSVDLAPSIIELRSTILEQPRRIWIGRRPPA